MLSPEPQPSQPKSHGPWNARLSLGFSERHRRTILTAEQHLGPLVIQRPFYPEDTGGCHVYILHPPGGVAGGDRLTFEARLGAGAQVLFTTPGATKYYRTGDLPASQHQALSVGSGGFLEWLPQETIVFSGADVTLGTSVELGENAGFVGWEILCLGRRAGGHSFDLGSVRQRFEVRTQEGPQVLDRALYEAKSSLLRAAYGLNGASVVGVLLIAQGTPALVESIRAGWAGRAALVSATLVNGIAICRYLGESAAEAKALFTDAWIIAKTALTGARPALPRIWAT
ncbi:MAG: urease accessory protein UreD [Polyangiaceae bacterium]|nr:urease accessory protein UreD [Polyangiaceae bacterium]